MVSRRQVLRAGVSRHLIVSKVRHGLWRQLHPGVYGAFTGALSREVRLWAAVLYAGPGALLSHETAAEVLGLADRVCPVIHVTIPATRRVRPPVGIAVHHSSFDYPRWRPQRGIPPHTFYPETIVDLAAAADNLDDVVAWVSRGIARHLVSEAQLKAAFAARSRLCWRDEIDEVIERVARRVALPARIPLRPRCRARPRPPRGREAGEVPQARRDQGLPRPLLPAVRAHRRA